MFWIPPLFLCGLVLVLLAVLLLAPRDKLVEDDLMGMTGLEGVAEETFSKEGTVFVRGELWRATTEQGIVQKGDKIRVVSVRTGLLLVVEGVKDQQDS